MTDPRALVSDLAATLAAAGVDSARGDAEQLASYVLGVPRGQLAFATAVTAEQERVLREYAGRRAAREPLQHIIGSAGFRHIELAVGPGVFVPRPETEVVAGYAIEAAQAAGPRPLVVDLCSGSGAIALSVANEVPGAVVHAVELDDGAVDWLRRNAAARAAAGDTPVTVHHADAGTALPALDGTVDVVASNPPYVGDDEFGALDPEVRDHDPKLALAGGDGGLAVVRVVERTAARLLKAGGVVVVEHSDRQGEAVPALFEETGRWRDVAGHLDLTGRPRYTTATKMDA